MTFTETFKKVFEGDKFMHVKIKSIDPQTTRRCNRGKRTN